MCQREEKDILNDTWKKVLRLFMFFSLALALLECIYEKAEDFGIMVAMNSASMNNKQGNNKDPELKNNQKWKKKVEKEIL